uniref:Ovule protein n=1 Tax=Meloidogyne incognita TaxID=6306 RepID=A0A914MZR7_MELIC
MTSERTLFMVCFTRRIKPFAYTFKMEEMSTISNLYIVLLFKFLKTDWAFCFFLLYSFIIYDLFHFFLK